MKRRKRGSHKQITPRSFKKFTVGGYGYEIEIVLDEVIFQVIRKLM